MQVNNFPIIQNPTGEDLILGWSSELQIVGLIRLGDLNINPSGGGTTTKFEYTNPWDGNSILQKRPDLFTISASSNLNDYNFFPLSVLIDGGNSSWASQNIPNSYISIIFNTPFKLNRYTLRGHTNNNQDHMRSWLLEGRNTSGAAFTTIETVNNSNVLDQGTWFTSGVLSAQPYNEYRLTMTSVGNTSRWFMALAEIGFYGEL